jgi:hypothetical protein
VAGKFVVCDEGGGDGSFLAEERGSSGYLALLATPRILPSFLQSGYRAIKQMNLEFT